MMQAQWQASEQAGEILTFEHCKGGYFSADETYSLRLVGRTAQDTLTGKNLVDFPNYEAFTPSNNIRANTNARFPTTYLANTAYTLSAMIEQEPGCLYGVGFEIKYTDGATDYCWLRYKGADIAASVTSDPAKTISTIKFSYDSVHNVRVLDVQLEVGTVATTYEPYCGRIPAPNPNYPMPIRCVRADTVVRCRGKNLCPPFDSTTNNGITFAANEDGSLTVNGTATGVATVEFKTATLAAGTYARAFHTSGVQFVAECRGDDGGTQYLSAVFTLEKTTDVRLYVQVPPSTTVENITIYPQLERGTAVTAYEPYIAPAEITLPCDLYKGDIWYPTTGKVERHNAIIPSYAGESLNNGYYATTGYAVTGATVVNPLATPVTEAYSPQVLPAQAGTVVVEQAPVDLAATLAASMLVRRR